MRKLCTLSAILLVLPLPAAADSGQAIYEKHCAPCHSSGDVNTPQIGSTEQWKLRSGYGAKSLLYSVKNGHNLMPPHGETLKDADTSAAIDYIVSKSGGWAKK